MLLQCVRNYIEISKQKPLSFEAQGNSEMSFWLEMVKQ